MLRLFRMLPGRDNNRILIYFQCYYDFMCISQFHFDASRMNSLVMRSFCAVAAVTGAHTFDLYNVLIPEGTR